MGQTQDTLRELLHRLGSSDVTLAEASDLRSRVDRILGAQQADRDRTCSCR